MELIIKNVHFAISKDLEELTKKKVEKLIRKYDFADVVTVTLSLDRREDKDNKDVSIHITVPSRGGAMYSLKSADTFEEALDRTLTAVEGQLEYFKNSK